MRGGAKKKMMKDIFHNKIVLYILLAIAVFNLLSYLGQNNLCAIVLFLVIGLSSTYYTKNMIFVLLSTIILTNLLVNVGFLRLFGLREGLEGEKKEGEKKEGEEKKGEEDEEESKKKDEDKHKNVSQTDHAFKKRHDVSTNEQTENYTNMFLSKLSDDLENLSKKIKNILKIK